MLSTILEKLGVGYAVRPASYAGHGIGEEKIQIPINKDDIVSDLRGSTTSSTSTSTSTTCNKEGGEVVPIGLQRNAACIAHTIDGQVQHKIDWTDLLVLEEMVSLQFQYQLKRKRRNGNSNNNNNNNDNGNDKSRPKQS